MNLTELYPNGGTPPTSFPEPVEPTARALADTGSDLVLLVVIGVLLLTLGVLLVVRSIRGYGRA